MTADASLRRTRIAIAEPDAEPAADTADTTDAVGKDQFLVALGERTRALRAQRGLTRKSLAKAAHVSERHLANVEMGVGNASVQFLRQLAAALGCQLVALVGDAAESGPEWLLIREILRGRSDADLGKARSRLVALFGAPASEAARRGRIALIGLRGAGKSTLGRELAATWGVPFVELNRHIESLAGCEIAEIHSLYGPAAYRRYEKRALEDVVERFPKAVIATPGGIVSDASTFGLLLSHCYTVWVRASTESHMSRVLAQGDTRPMAGNAEAMKDLRRILDSRSAFYSKADIAFDTDGLSAARAGVALRKRLEAVAAAERTPPLTRPFDSKMQ